MIAEAPLIKCLVVLITQRRFLISCAPDTILTLCGFDAVRVVLGIDNGVEAGEAQQNSALRPKVRRLAHKG